MILNLNGWIKLHRRIKIEPFYQSANAQQRDLYIQLLLLANHEENTWEFKGKSYTCKPGEFITSVQHLAELCAKGMTISKVRTGLKKMEKFGVISYETSNQNHLIKICSWHEDQANLANDLTDGSQSNDKPIATNKKERKERVESTPFSSKESITDSVLKEIAEELRVDFYDAREAWEILSDYLESEGKEKTNYRAALKAEINKGIRDQRIERVKPRKNSTLQHQKFNWSEGQ